MGCNCCKEVNHADYKKCQQDIDRILRNCKTTSSKQYLLLMASLLHLMQRLQCQKRRNVKIEDKDMTREEAKELLPIIQAFAEGKTIQFLDGCKWIDVCETDFHESTYKYRIKPEPKYRPFKTKEECWNEMLKHHPFGWLKSKMNGRFSCIGEVSLSDEFETVHIALSTSESLSRSANSMFEQYTFYDGTPFGIKEE